MCAFRCLTIGALTHLEKILKTSSPIFTPFGRTTFANTVPLATNAVPDAHVLNRHVFEKILAGGMVRGEFCGHLMLKMMMWIPVFYWVSR